MYWFPRVALTKRHHISGLKQQKFLVSQFWKLEDQSPGVGRSMFPLKAIGEGPFPISGSSKHSLPLVA